MRYLLNENYYFGFSSLFYPAIDEHVKQTSEFITPALSYHISPHGICKAIITSETVSKYSTYQLSLDSI